MLLVLLLLLRGADSTSGCDASSYYASVSSSSSSSSSSLWNSLHAIVDGHTVIPYTSTATDVWDALEVLDADANNANNVLLVYSQRSEPKANHVDASGWNREHVWPKSYGVGYTGADTSDLHSLRAADWGVNSARSNLYFDTCTHTGCSSPAHAEAAADTAKDSAVFMPPANQRGDLARSLMYMAVRYDGTDANTEDLRLSDCPCSYGSTMGMLSTLLAWHVADPPDAAEIERTGLVCSAFQGNRNPFVDHPEWAAQLWPTPDASESQSCQACVDTSSSPSTSSIAANYTASAGDVALTGMTADDPDSFRFVVLREGGLPAGTQLRFTDSGWSESSGAFRNGEGTLLYTVPLPGLAAGTHVLWSGETSGDWELISGSVALSVSGDQLFVYTHPVAAVGSSLDTATVSLLFAVDFKGANTGWDAGAESSTTSSEPLALTQHSPPLALALTHKDNYAYSGTTTGTAAELLLSISTPAYWTGDNADRAAAVATAAFVVLTTASNGASASQGSGARITLGSGSIKIGSGTIRFGNEL